MKRFLIAAGTSAVVVCFLFALYWNGALTGSAFVRISFAILAAVLAFYLVFRTGLNRRAADPSLTVAQMAVAGMVILYAMYAADHMRGVLQVALLMTYLFGLFRLRAGELVLAAALVLIGNGAVIVLVWKLKPQTLIPGEELLRWFVFAVMLVWFGMMGGYVKRLNERLRKSDTEQRVALSSLAASEALLAESQRIARLGSWSYEPAARMARWSAETYRIFGVDPGQPAPTGQALLKRIHAEDRAHYRQLILSAIDERRSIDGEYRIVVRDSEVRWVQVRAEPQVCAGGQTRMVRGTVVDITERKAQERAILSAQQQADAGHANLSDAIESLSDAFALFDANDRLAICNRRFAKTFTDFDSFEAISGLSYEDLVRSSLAKGEVIDPAYGQDVDAWVAARVRLHQQASAEPREVELGGGRWLQILEHRTSSGGIVGVRRDITERKHLEQRQAMEHAVTRVLADSGTCADAMPKIIETICRTLGWDCGARWHWDEQDRALHCAETWGIPSPAVTEFLAASRRRVLLPESAGLIRRVWASGEPVWIADVSREPGFGRRAIAEKAGLRAAFAFPIARYGAIAGVMEFYTRVARQPDAALLRVTESIRLQIEQFQARREAEAQLHRLAHFDLLTSLPNRVLFNETLKRSLADARRRGTQVALLFIDLDGFKKINDSLGHAAGDCLLRSFADRLRVCLRESDCVARHGAAETAARLGGDEFVVLIDDAPGPGDIAGIAQRILETAARPFDLAGREGRISASIGVSLWPADGADAETLIRHADSAMYRAKQAGKNEFRFHSTVQPGQQSPAGQQSPVLPLAAAIH